MTSSVSYGDRFVDMQCSPANLTSLCRRSSIYRHTSWRYFHKKTKLSGVKFMMA